jgi:dienelactone hydrolase
MCSLVFTAQAQDVLDAELRESVARVEVRLTDFYGRSETRPLVITTFRPPGAGRHPLVVFNHGRPAGLTQLREMGRQRYLAVARFFAAQGFVVMVPTRVGYGETADGFDPDAYGGSCARVDLRSREESLRQQVLATLEYAKSQWFVDASNWLVAGHSVGGFTAITVANRPPPGLLGAINFAGGYGGDPVNRKGQSCSPQVWEATLRREGLPARPPSLWIYWRNDNYFGAEVPRRWFEAFEAGGGLGRFVQLQDIPGDGHGGVNRDFSNWVPPTLAFLRTLPLQLTLVEPPATPAATGFAALAEVDKLPFVGDRAREAYRAFLARGAPRAFAISQDGRWGWSNAQWNTAARALAMCNRAAKPTCQLYAVDDEVVWPH